MNLQLIGKIAAFALYLAFMVYIGIRSSKKTNNAKDFFLGMSIDDSTWNSSYKA